ncbi:FtsK/SpoIIIE domain-containing protein [soil metagenome]
MRLKFTLDRRGEGSADIVVTTDATATVGDIAAAILVSDPLHPQQADPTAVTLVVSPPAFATESELSPSTPIGEAAIGSGFTVRISNAHTGRHETTPRVAAIARVLTGPDAGREFGLPPGESTVGRDPSCAIVLADPLASKVHAKVIVGDTIEVADLNSANGLLIDGGVVTRVTVDERQTVTVGASELGFRRVGAIAHAAIAERGGALAFNRAPRVEARYPGEELPTPQPPSTPDKGRFPWISLLAPLVTGIAMYAFFQSPFALLFVALAPILVLGSYIDGGLSRKRTLERDTDRFNTQLHELSAKLSDERPREYAARNAEAPSTAEVYADAMQLGPLLWTRRPEHWSFLGLRLGTGTLPSRNTLTPAGADARAIAEFVERTKAVTDPFRQIDGVPLVESPEASGAIGVVGDQQATADVVRSLLVQLVGLHSPAEVAVAAIVSPRWSPELGWLGWLPHTASPQSPLGDTVHLADSAATGEALIASLEALVDARGASSDPAQAPLAQAVAANRRGALGADDGATETGSRVGAPGGITTGAAKQLPALFVVVSDDAPVDRARLVQIAERATEAGVYFFWVAAAARDLPAVCRSWVDVTNGVDRTSVALVRLGRVEAPMLCERVSNAQATALARRMAPLVDSGAVTSDSSDLPPSVSFLTLVGLEFADSSAAVVDRWQQNDSLNPRGPAATGITTPPEPRLTRRAGSLRALVGVSGADSMHLDLRTNGPHALVGGTTGSGKSEFLRAWVLGMAMEYSPDRVTFLFVDYKGGSAFAECVSLPHSVGLVTDLSPHLVRRALTSLRAELQFRERLLGRKKAKDLLELEKRGDAECPPALVLVIDEFAALANDVPEFVDGVVDIAQRGRSLGIHLIMATQRPAGVIKDNLRANTNLRVALRMADEHDSDDVVGEKTAARFDPSLPGRAIAKTGPGRVTAFQSAYVGGFTRRGPERAAVKVAELRFGAEVVWESRVIDPRSVMPDESGPNDESRLVSTIMAAAQAGELPAPRRPWLDELRTEYDLADLPHSTDAALPFGIADIPERQVQEPVFFRPDTDGHLAVFGSGGSGKSALLRSIGVTAGLSATAGAVGAGGAVEVYALDFAGGGLRMLEHLPHVGSVISGDDSERIGRLLSKLVAVLDERSKRFSEVNAATIEDYRSVTGRRTTARILLLVDGFPAFRSEWELAGGRGPRYAEFVRLLAEGRQVGIHVALSADRPGSVPSSVSSAVSRRVILRLSDESAYLMLDAPDDVLSAASPPGRAIVEGHEAQIAVYGGSPSVLEQSRAIERLATGLRRSGVAEVEPIGALPTEVGLGSMPVDVGGRPLLGIADHDLAPIGFEPTGTMVVAGGPASGRTNALFSLVQAMKRWRPETELFYLGERRSALATGVGWRESATTPDEVAELARRLVVEVAGESPEHPIAVVIESLGDFLSTVADTPIVDLVRAVKRSDHLLIAEAETSAWSSSWPLFAELKNARRGLLLQPDTLEGETILRTALPRVTRSEFPPGRGYYIASGKANRVQLPLALPAQLPAALAPTIVAPV